MSSHNKNQVIVYPGSFDPITLGHLDLLKRAVKLFDRVIVAIATGSKPTMFSAGERLALIEAVLKQEQLIDVAHVEIFDGLLVDFMRNQKATFLLRGLRTVTDFEFEFQLARANRLMHADMETVFFMPDEGLSFISASLVREIARYNGKLSSFVPASVEEALRAKIQSQASVKDS